MTSPKVTSLTFCPCFFMLPRVMSLVGNIEKETPGKIEDKPEGKGETRNIFFPNSGPITYHNMGT